jgi:hypothetical protein
MRGEVNCATNEKGAARNGRNSEAHPTSFGSNLVATMKNIEMVKNE